ncbi:hypothetical protein FSPOR_10588 [Fusarium sporotrichioides]|uniref:Uncharacterized protein n=1 Tax=Fusarium sporotrichioides TaxID=5514 RepID=A0A395RKJ6_FUSSP|nr:hypothetical protein FSPOR_10588 [Fusarium sporotrichioides]
MCEHRITWRYCPSCRNRAPVPLKHNIHCDKVNLWKLGRCGTGLRDREIVERVECYDCQTRRVRHEEKERRRLWEQAWPGPVQLLKSPVRPEMKNASQQTVEKWPKVGSQGGNRGDEIVVQQTQVKVMYDADDEDDDQGLVMLRKRSKNRD